MTSTAATNGPTTPMPLRPGVAGREVREVIRDEQIMRNRILAVLQDGPHTIPEIAETLGRPSHEVTFWIMGLRKYGWVRELKEVTDEGYFQYERTERDV
jgi:predicted ArsR family transcriptional regulator